MSFYLSLPSNSSMEYFQSNTLTKFTTKLHTPINLEGSYEVAISEMIFPFNWLSSVKGTIEFGELTAGGTKKKLDLSKRKYQTLRELVHFINTEMRTGFKKTNKSYCSYNPSSLRIEFFLEKNEFIQLDEDSMDLLGFSFIRYEGIYATSYLKSPYLNTVNALYIYSDISEYQYIGDTYAPLLRVVAVPNVQYNEYVDVIYDNPHYVPVLRNSIETIELDIRSDTGDQILLNAGKGFVKLHFRPKRLY